MSNTPNMQQQLQYLKDLAAYYNGQGEERLEQDLLRSIRAQKQAGQLTNEQLEQLLNRFSPLLNPEQCARLQKLMDLVKAVS